MAQFCPPINLKSIDLHPLYSHNLRRHDVQRETNLEQSAAAGPFPLCRTAHASFDPENYLKSTEGHIRWRRSDFEHILRHIPGFKRTAQRLTSWLQTGNHQQTHFVSYLSNAETLSPAFSSARLVPQAASAAPLWRQKTKCVGVHNFAVYTIKNVRTQQKCLTLCIFLFVGSSLPTFIFRWRSLTLSPAT